MAFELAGNAVAAAVDQVQVRAWMEPGTVLVQVEDDGAGMSPARR